MVPDTNNENRMVGPARKQIPWNLALEAGKDVKERSRDNQCQKVSESCVKKLKCSATGLFYK